MFIEETNGEEKVSLGHMSIDILPGFEFEAFMLCLQCVKARISNDGDGNAFGKFEHMARDWALRMVGVIELISLFQGIDPFDFQGLATGQLGN